MVIFDVTANSMLQEHVHYLNVPERRCMMRGVPPDAVGRVDLGACSQKPLHNIGVATLRRTREWGIAVCIQTFDVGRMTQ